MALDGFTLSALIAELRPILVNTRVDRVFQPAREEIVLELRGSRDTHRLVVSADARLARLHLGGQPVNPASPPPFCMALRKQIGGSRLMAVRQEGLERVVVLDFETYDELNGVTVKRFYLELMGKHSNLILADAGGQIIDAIKHVNEQQSRYREVLPGLPYNPPPPQHKVDPCPPGIEELGTVLERSDPAASLVDTVVKRVSGIGPLLAAELAFRAGLPQGATVASCSEALLPRLRDEIAAVAGRSQTGEWDPCAAIDPATGRVAEFSCIPLTHLLSLGFTVEPGPLSQWISAAYSHSAEAQRIGSLTQHLTRTLSQAAERARRRVEIHRRGMEGSEDTELWRAYGELLQAAPGGSGRGQSSITMINYFDAECRPIDIPLDPALDLRENARTYFKKFSKAKRGRLAATEQYEAAQNELEYLESVQATLAQATRPAEIDEVRSELEMGGYIRSREKKRRGAVSASAPLRFRSSSGHEILVGRNNLQNDRVTTEMAGPNDLWFHVQKIPGSHVVIRRPNPVEPDWETLWEAANLAAYFSKSRGSSKVPVDYTQRKHVRKPPGSRPGAVLYDNFKTITVDPDGDVLARFRLKIDL